MKTINNEYKIRIFELINKMKLATPEKIRIAIMEETKKPISWLTVKRHLERLVNDGLIEKELFSKGIKRNMIIYKSK